MRLKDLMYIGLFAAIIGVLAFFPPIAIPFIPVPITAQSFGVMLAGGLLGGKRGGISLLLFLLLVMAGAPLMAGGRGGLAVLFGPGGGYILAWPIAAFCIGYSIERLTNKLRFWHVLIINFLAGMILVYLIGVTYLVLLTKAPWSTTFISSFIFIPGDLLKACLASLLTIRLRKIYPM